MPRPDELDRCWYKNDPSAEEIHDYYRNDPPLPRQTHADDGVRWWVYFAIAAAMLVCAVLAAPVIVSDANAGVNGCEAYRAEMVACAEGAFQ